MIASIIYLKNAIALNVSVSKTRWEIISETLKTISKAYNRGAAILVDDPLAAKLWELIRALDLCYVSGGLTVESAKGVIMSVMRHDVVDERQRLASVEAESEADEKAAKKYTLKQWIREFIRQCEDGERLKRRSTRMITHGTIKSYKGTLAQLEAFEAAKHKVVDFDDMTMDFYDAWKAFFIKKLYSPNTIGRHVKNLKTFLFAAEDMKLTTRQDYRNARFSVDHEDVDNVYLTKERIQQMYECLQSRPATAYS